MLYNKLVPILRQYLTRLQTLQYQAEYLLLNCHCSIHIVKELNLVSVKETVEFDRFCLMHNVVTHFMR